MDIYKLTVESMRYYPLTREGYSNMTGKKPPYFKIGEDGKMRHYAVCPSCDNPVQIIGLMRQDDKDLLYARHIPKSIFSLANYNQAAYDDCPLAASNPEQVEKSTRKNGGSGISQKILDTLREHFDRVVLVLQKSVGFIISSKLAESMLEDYLAEEGYRYKYASLLNIPWMLAYMSASKSLVGRILKDEDMKQAILAGEPHAAFSGDQLVGKEKAFLQINVHFSGHRLQPHNNTVLESMRMIVSGQGRGHTQPLYEKQIVFNPDDFQYLLGIPEGKGTRNQALLDIARSKIDGAC